MPESLTEGQSLLTNQELSSITSLTQKFQFIRKIGEGGMSNVFLALDIQRGRQVAVKVLKEHVKLNPEMSRRFLFEAKILNKSKHPGIVNLFDQYHSNTKPSYLIMEYLDGIQLHTVLADSSSLPLVNKIIIFEQIISAVQFLHSVKIIHRDLKPTNIIVVPDVSIPGGVRAKVIDFGIAKLTEVDPLDPPPVTAHDMVMGTPVYMAPEQCLEPTAVSWRCDIYSVGVMLYQGIVGRLPYSGSRAQLLLQSLRTELPQLTSIADGIDPALSNLIHRMTSHDLLLRPTHEEILQGFQRFIKAHLSAVVGPRFGAARHSQSA